MVNALLTQLDKLKHRKNVLVMSTSNLAKAIGGFELTYMCNHVYNPLTLSCLDSAFVDRADIIQYVDLPPRDAIYEILRSCLSELVSRGIINDVVRITWYRVCRLNLPVY